MTMQYRTLGRTGIQVSTLGLGTMVLGAWGNTDRDACARIVHRALDAGINLVDTADVYAFGESEEIVGDALRGRRDDVVLATKFHNPMGDDRNQRGNSRRWIRTAVEGSLRRLDTDRIDLYQVHRPDPATDIAETIDALTDLVRGRQDPRLGHVDLPGRGDRRDPLGRRSAPRRRATHRAAALLDPRPWDRTCRAAHVRAPRPRGARWEPVGGRLAHREVPGRLPPARGP